MRLSRPLKFASVAALAAFAGVAAWLFFQQDALIHFPEHVAPEEMEELARAEGFVPWNDAAGRRIGWHSAVGDPANILLVFHGNGQHALHRNYFSYRARESDGWKTYLLEYPGYGDREGRPTERSLTRAADEAVDLLAEAPRRKIRILGQSLWPIIVNWLKES